MTHNLISYRRDSFGERKTDRMNNIPDGVWFREMHIVRDDSKKNLRNLACVDIRTIVGFL